MGVLAVAAASLLLPGPVVAVASDGPWVAAAEGRSARDCDRVSIWNTRRPKVFRMGRKTSCATTGGITSLSAIHNRALWLHVTGGEPRAWTLWTASTTSRAPRLLARIAGRADDPPPIVIGPGNKDRALMTVEGGDVLPYAIGQQVVVLRADGRRSFTWIAPSAVTALGSDPHILVVAVSDGRIFLFQHWEEGWKLIHTYPGSVAATRVFWGGLSVFAQRGSWLEDLAVTEDDCSGTRTLRAGEQLVAASGGRIVLLLGERFRVLPGCRRRPVAAGVATAIALDNDRLTSALGRRVTTRLLPSP